MEKHKLIEELKKLLFEDLNASNDISPNLLKIKEILISLNENPDYVYINKTKKRIGYLYEDTRKKVCDYIISNLSK